MEAPRRQDEEPAQLARLQRAGAILWPSFFSAGVATMVCFALFDPYTLSDAVLPEFMASRELVYTLGFFAFWIATAASSLFTALLLGRPRPQRD